jgi:hypothetical protein
MKKILLLTLLWFTAGSVYVLAGQGEPVNKGGSPGIHEAKFNVFDYTTKKPLADAGLYNASGVRLGSTDSQGILTLQLPATATEVYVIKSDGFTPINVRLTQADKQSADYEVFLQPKGDQPEEPNPSPALAAQNAQPEQDVVKVYVKQDPATYQKTKKETTANVEFAVQLSASSKPVTNKNTLKSWEDLGHVYVHTENGLYKVRIGPFYTQEDAKSVLLKVKARGTKDAFIVVQKGTENHPPYEFMNRPAEKTEPTAMPEKVTTPVPQDNTSDLQGEYKVRLASYLHPGGFNTKDIDQYGTLESYRQGEWTIMLIGGFKTKEDACKVRDLVKAKGYTDAKVVMDQGGVLVETN